MTSPALDRAGELTLLRFPHISVPHGVATRLGGVSGGRYASLNLGPRSGDDLGHVATNRDRFLTALGDDHNMRVAPRQTHSADVAVYRNGDLPPERGVYDGDGIVTDATGTTLVILAADCAPLLLHDPGRGVVAAVHAGWRGTGGGIARRAVQVMAERFGCDPVDIRAAIGPAIGLCCYQVGAEVVDAVTRATPAAQTPLYEPDGGDRFRLDLTAANRAQLLSAGLHPAHVLDSGLCTACRTDLFFSHRREGEPTGRNGAAIALPVATG